MTEEKNRHSKTLIEQFGLMPHPEGGHYRETYRSKGTIPAGAFPAAFKGDRHYSSPIIFLLEKGDVSRLHCVRSDETGHFYGGGPLRPAMISPDGLAGEVVLGSDIAAGHHIQYAVPAGVWFGAKPCAETAFSLVGCTVAPGFDFADFELGGKRSLESGFPRSAGLH